MKTKKILLGSFLLFVLVIIYEFAYIPGEEFNLSESEQKVLFKEAKKGNMSAVEKLYLYYNYTKADYKKTIDILRIAAKHNDPKFQRILAFYLLRKDFPHAHKITKYEKEEGVFWLKKSASQNDLEAKRFLKEYNEQNISGKH